MKVTKTALPGVLLLEPARHGDERGLFVEAYKAEVLKQEGVDATFIQDNVARSTSPGVVRGLHFQRPPVPQAKLLRCARGAILDVVVDIREGSSTFGQVVTVELSEQNWLQLFVPTGFAHGYCTLTPETEVQYKVSAPYAPEHEGGLLWNDPELGIRWPVSVAKATLNARDRSWPTLAQLSAGPPPFPADQQG